MGFNSAFKWLTSISPDNGTKRAIIITVFSITTSLQNMFFPECTNIII